MTNNLKRRVEAMECGGGSISLGEMIDAIDLTGLSYDDPATWPTAWRGRSIDQRIVRSLVGVAESLDADDGAFGEVEETA